MSAVARFRGFGVSRRCASGLETSQPRNLVTHFASAARDPSAPRHRRLLACIAAEPLFRALRTQEEARATLHAFGATDERLAMEGFAPDLLGSVRARMARWASHGPALRADCTVFFARYAFTAEEVVAEIRRQVRVTGGVHDFPVTDHPWNLEEARLCMQSLPPYEREIVQRLIDANVVYWVAESTPSTPNALVEYPRGTVVLVVKPPGSDVEIEIKRAGVRGAHALDVRYTGERGEVVPEHHHLWGASRGELLRFEAGAAALFARIHRRVHGGEPPVPRIVTLTRIDAVPKADGGTASILSYFDDAAEYGRGFAAMRAAMAAATPRIRSDAPAAGFLTGDFLTATLPQQAILVGTSAFRLDRMAAQLDLELLEEIVDDFVYDARDDVEAAFARNRLSADRTFLSLVAQAARTWGTLLGVRGTSDGESFVTRNSGLRKQWRDGRWSVRLIAMDHDALQIAGRLWRNFQPLRGMRSLLLDRAHVMGGVAGPHRIKGQLQTLRELYRVDDAVARAGDEIFTATLREAYRRTQSALADDAFLRALFRRDFTQRLGEWDRVVRDFAGCDDERRWRRRTRARLRRRGFERALIDQYVAAVLRSRDAMPWLAAAVMGG